MTVFPVWAIGIALIFFVFLLIVILAAQDGRDRRRKRAMIAFRPLAERYRPIRHQRQSPPPCSWARWVQQYRRNTLSPSQHSAVGGHIDNCGCCSDVEDLYECFDKPYYGQQRGHRA